ncbi:DUF3014 domain-containing protein [Arsukibacterium indicum]|uniref:DUF3014 domain-containing protein n=1 Tax=Arsukibacterium indicum TaxID=2848612 RepID=A0ABS6MIS8_9GAMM|nr:DUF3014 domain-containing protein [Arsukibacterium indicum]MBV2128132.1 DUF3014 domain-containing protein [Arsukibacterium indicum]
MTAQPSGSGQQLYYAGIAAVVIVILLALWLLVKPASEPDPDSVGENPVPARVEIIDEQPVPPALQEPAAEMAAETDSVTEPAETEPEVTLPEPAPEPLPALENSDPVLKQEVLKLNWQPGLAGLINTEQMIRNLVVTVDNLAQRQLVAKHPVVKPLDQPFVAIPAEDNQTYQLDPSGYQRYEPYIRLLENAEPAQIVGLLKQYQPLFEQAFGELGYPELSFNQRLQQALQQFLAIEPVNADTTLVRKSVAYTYADPQVEALSDLEKQVIRLGPANHQRLRVVAQKYLALLQNADL